MRHSSKRKREDLSDSDDEEPSFGRQILPVANLPEDFHGLPEDGLQYLFTVRRDARYLPLVTRATNPYEYPDQHPATTLTSKTSLDTSHSALPEKEWRTSFENHFRNFRQNIIQPTIHVHTPQHQKGRLMPEKKERDLWWAFVAGKPETEWNPSKPPKQSTNVKSKRKFGRMRGFSDCEEPGKGKDRKETWRINDDGDIEPALKKCDAGPLQSQSHSPIPEHPSDNVTTTDCKLGSTEGQGFLYTKPREPTPSLLAHVDHRMSLHLLMYFTHWINLHLQGHDPAFCHITETHARWMFVLLSRVGEHTTSDDMSLLRGLARACLGLIKGNIKKRPVDGENVTQILGHQARSQDLISERSCWMIVTAVADIWGQLDLWMEAEAVLIASDSLYN